MSARAKKKSFHESNGQVFSDLLAYTAKAEEIRTNCAFTGQEVPSLNKALISIYQEQTGCTDFRTFLSWKDAGYSVKKGSKAFRLWGKPVKSGETGEIDKKAKTHSGESKGEQLNGKKFYPMCCVFNESQVEIIATAGDETSIENNI